jgi:uncharacterized Zn finger protein
MYWSYNKKPAPKAAAGATRKTYGNTWWGKQWLQTMDQIDEGNRLPRGKTYANKGLVKALEIQGNTITANVQGSDPRPYKIRIQIPVFDAATQEKLVHLVTDNPLFLSKLLNRELPPELNDACLKAGIPIFPRSFNDLKGSSCSCPDWALPCKHMAAVLFVVANEIDKNPFTVFDLHHFSLVDALEKSGFTQGAAEDIPITRFTALQHKTVEETALTALDEDRLARLDLSTIPNIRTDLLRLLDSNPVFYPEGDFKKILSASYEKAANVLTKIVSPLKHADTRSETDHRCAGVEQVLLLLNGKTGQLEVATFLDGNNESLLNLLTIGDLIAWLEEISPAALAVCAPPLRSLHLIHQLAEALVRKGAFVPQLLRMPGDKTYAVRFIPALLNEDVRILIREIKTLISPGLVVFDDGKDGFEPVPDDYLNATVALFIGHYLDMHHGKIGGNGIIPEWFFSGDATVFDRFDHREYPKSIQLWLNRFFITEKQFVPVFEVNDIDDGFELLVSIEDKTTPFEPPVPLDKVFSSKTYAPMRLDMLRDLTNISTFFPALSGLIASKGKERLYFNSQTFVAILFDTLPVIRLFGIKVLLPKALQKLLRPQAGARLSRKGKVPGTGLLSFASMIDFQWEMALGDQRLSPEAFMTMVKKMRGIVRLADGYALIDEKEIAALLDKIQNGVPPSGHKLLQLAIAGEYDGAPVSLDASARALMEELLRPDAVALPAGLNATLRPYQQRGFEWMYKNTRLGFGSLIADDMGLGKTLQVIATLLRLKEDGAIGVVQKALIVVPTTLLTNWNKEVQRFAPSLCVHTYHGPGRSLDPLDDADILLTTYGVVRTEIAALQKKNWAIAVIDEAQNIKNMDTVQSKAVKKINAPVRIAMSGTPVENRMSEYFSVFDFANAGYLGTLKAFTTDFAQPIETERNQKVLQRFKTITSPFLLRRVKTDKTIINDLPDKVEQNQYAILTQEQAALYQSVVDTSLQALEKEANIQRQGLVLKMLTALKQVCNHPAQYLKTKAADPALSGKTQMLLDLLTPIMDNGEKVLIFTQYQEMGNLLIPIIRAHTGHTPAFLHGGVSRKDRDAMVDQFQNNRATKILILSLKAGGTGLNLTAASNVIHYDLWWNPAVEAQATDRAYRIGQQRNVQVHRFITQGSFEEKIDLMIQSKKELANLTVANGEKWIGELTNAELKELVALG